MEYTVASRLPLAVDQFQEQAERLLRYQPTRALAELWHASYRAAPAGSLPGFDPLDAAPLLPHLYLLERDGDQLRYRVSGESVNELFGTSHTGKLLSDVVPAAIYDIVAPYFHDVLSSKVCIFKGYVVHRGHSPAEFERVMLPVQRDGGVQILAALSLSSTATLCRVDDLPPPPESGFHFTQIDLIAGTVARHRVALKDIPVDALPFKSLSQMKRRA
ncbi:MAG: PAS domain-containing protein [Thalassobaculum sp.]